MSRDSEAKKVLKRFETQIWWAVHQVRKSFSLRKQDNADLYQEACLMVLSYAGLTAKPICGNGNLARWTENVGGDEKSIKKLMSRQLRIALSQQVGRQLKKRIDAEPLPHEVKIYKPTVYYQDVIPFFPGGELCAYCGEITEPYIRHVDHNHSCCPTGFVCGDCVRGLTHPWCNTGAIAKADRQFREGEQLSPRDASYVHRSISDIHPFLGGGSKRLYDKAEQMSIPPVPSAEDTCLSDMFLAEQEADLRRNYPYFTAQVLDGLTVAELMKLGGAIRGTSRCSRGTVMRRLKEEKARFIESVSG